MPEGRAGHAAIRFPDPTRDKNKVLLIEIYKDEDAFQSHWNGRSMAIFREKFAGMVAKMSGTGGTLAE